MEPINLQQRFGDRFRITYDPAYDSRNVPKGKRDPWMMQLPCAGKGVTIYPFGGDLLAAEVDYRPSVARRLQALPEIELRQDGIHEKTFLFPLAVFEQVAAIVKPRKRRILTDAQKTALAEMGKAHGFRPLRQ